jgi:recombination protein RecA
VLDHEVLKLGGWPAGRVIELFGPEGGGKSALLWRAFGSCQKQGGLTMLVDAEKSVDREWAKLHEVDLGRMMVAEADSMEEAFTSLEIFMRSLNPAEGPHLAGWDSLAASAPREELDGLITDSSMGVRARLANRGFRKITALASKANCTLIVVNQVREKLNVLYGNPETTPGGKALKHHASIRLRVGSPKLIEGENAGALAESQEVPMKLVKSRFRPADKGPGVLTRLNFTKGWDGIWSTVTFAKLEGVIASDSKVTEKNAREAADLMGWSGRMKL